MRPIDTERPAAKAAEAIHCCRREGSSKQALQAVVPAGCWFASRMADWKWDVIEQLTRAQEIPHRVFRRWTRS